MKSSSFLVGLVELLLIAVLDSWVGFLVLGLFCLVFVCLFFYLRHFFSSLP